MSSPGKVLLCDLLSDTLKTDPVTPQRTRQYHLERCCRYKAKTHTLALSKHAPLYFIIFLLNNIFKSKNRCRDVSHPLPQPPRTPAHISPDSRSSELERERRSRSNDSDLSRSLSLALSVGGDTSLSTQSLSSAFSSRHPSSGGKHSLSRG